MDDVAYKIVEKDVWESQLKDHGKFVGTPLDVKDGYIHLSAKPQVKETARKYFAGKDGLIMICVDLTKVDGEIKWEESRNRELFPHIYGAITKRSVVWLRPLLCDKSRTDFVYPAEFEA